MQLTDEKKIALATFRAATLPRIFGQYDHCAKRIFRAMVTGEDVTGECFQQIELAYDMVAEPFDDVVVNEFRVQHRELLAELFWECYRTLEDMDVPAPTQDQICRSRIGQAYEQLIDELLEVQDADVSFWERVEACTMTRIQRTSRTTLTSNREISRLRGLLEVAAIQIGLLQKANEDLGRQPPET